VAVISGLNAQTEKHPGVAVISGPYVVWIFVHGALSAFYPYPFVNVGELGYPRVLLNTAGLFMLFLALGFLLVGVDRLIARARRAS
jgi:hypothetical protein